MTLSSSLPVAAYAESSRAPHLTLVPERSRAVPLVDDQTVRALQPVLLRIAQRMVREDALASDIVQETWVSALRCAHAYEGRSSLLTWLVAILRRRACDALRRGKQHCTQELDDNCWTSGPTWEDQLHARDYLASMRDALEQLSERERAALALCDVDGLERDQAAEQLSVTRGHLRVLLHRAHRQLRQAKPKAARLREQHAETDACAGCPG